MATALTTRDNPFNPITQNDSWLNYDLQKGHNTYGLIARIADYDNDLDSPDSDESTEQAMNVIVKMDPLMYAIVDENTDIRAMNQAWLSENDSDESK